MTEKKKVHRVKAQTAKPGEPGKSVDLSGHKVDGAGSVMSTVSGPTAASAPTSLGQAEPVSERLLEKVGKGGELSAQMPSNPTKPMEYGEGSRYPQEGACRTPGHDAATGSTSSEIVASDKVGGGEPPVGLNRTTDTLDRMRADSSGRVLTTNQAVPVADNQGTLKAGLRGPSLLQDFIFREKVMHFDHERIPERVVHARGSGAHGVFECTKDLRDLTRALLFSEIGKRTPVFVRFSTVIGERGSTDTARDIRGFAVKFYTEQGNWDLVGNNIPVFFIQDAMKFPDLIHAAKPEPHFAMPQAATAHDTFWDFISLTPESAHVIMWAMSDRAIPRSYRTMQGFGVHTFRLVNADNRSVLCKFHWNPMQGTHSLTWDEAVKISGADPDFHRRDLWEAIDTGNFPQWELGLQVFTEEQAEGFGFDVLDPTKIVPEEMVPVTPVGVMTLNRNPDNFFAETEQVAFCTAHVVPGIDFTNDPLLQGRLFSYQDTQLIRLGGPNFHEIPINAPIAQVHNNQRDGYHRQCINRGRVSYDPNSLAGGSPNQAGIAGMTTFPAFIEGDMLRGKPELFADHYSQATLFWKSQTPAEQNHIVWALGFELGRVQTPAVRRRVVAMLVNIDQSLAERVATALGMPEVPPGLPLAAELTTPRYEPSSPLSLISRPGRTGIRTRRVAILVAPGVNDVTVTSAYRFLLGEGAVPRLVGCRFGRLQNGRGEPLEVEATVMTTPSVLYDAAVLPDGDEACRALAADGLAQDFVREQYRHCKPMLVVGDAASAFLDKAGVPSALPDGSADKALIGTTAEGLDTALETFKSALAGHRMFERESEPPRV